MDRKTNTNSRVRKTHYDHKHAISLEISGDYDSYQSEGMAMAKAADDGFIVDSTPDNNYTGAFEANTSGFQDDDADFSHGYSGGEMMAKAYDFDFNESQISSAKAYDDQIPKDEDNNYSDVFDASEEDLFKDFQTQVSESKQADLPIADEMDDDDKLARDLQAVLSGQKSLANLAEYAEGMQQTPQNAHSKGNNSAGANHEESETDAKVKALEKKMEQNEAIFDKIASDQKSLTTYQLGEVKLGSIFDEADEQMGRPSVALAKDRVQDMVDENSMAMDGLEWAEDFEVMDSIAVEEQETQESPIQNEPQTEAQSKSDSDIKDAVIEEEITVNPNDNTVTE